MAKNVIDSMFRLNIWALERCNLFKIAGRVLDVSWRNDIIAQISANLQWNNIQIIYSGTKIAQNVYLNISDCYIGNFRYWFLCPDCGKRVGTLYTDGSNLFSCRSCLDLGYESQRKNYRKKSFALLKRFDNYFKGNELSDQLRRFSYAGKPTKKVQRINYLYEHSIF